MVKRGEQMNKRAVLGILAAVVVLAASMAQAGSIWAKRDKNRKDVYTDDVARSIGDILTIKITEDSKVDNKAKRDLKKETKRTSDFNGELNIDNVLPKMPGFHYGCRDK